MLRLNVLMRHEPDLRSWMEAWSIGAIYNMYVSGESFFRYYRNLVEEKLRTAGELYEFMVDEFHHARAFILEALVVAILIIELGRLLWH